MGGRIFPPGDITERSLVTRDWLFLLFLENLTFSWRGHRALHVVLGFCCLAVPRQPCLLPEETRTVTTRSPATCVTGAARTNRKNHAELERVPSVSHERQTIEQFIRRGGGRSDKVLLQ